MDIGQDGRGLEFFTRLNLAETALKLARCEQTRVHKVRAS